LKKMQPKNGLLTCPICSRLFCSSCGLQDHRGSSCDDAIRLQGFNWDQIGSGEGKANRCPKCNSPFEKMSGCQHMTCSICKYEWCWVCGLPYHSCLHYGQMGGIICELIGAITFSSKSGCCQAILYLTAFFLLPLICLFLCFMLGGGLSFLTY